MVHLTSLRSVALTMVLGLALGVGACSSSDSKGTSSNSSAAQKGGGAKNAKGAKSSGQKASKKAAESKSNGTDKGATAGGAGATKNGGAHSPADAKASSEKPGPKASAAKSSAEDKGASYEEVTCDDAYEDIGFCADESHLVFCSEGHWWFEDCSTVEQGAFCGEDAANSTVDCYVEFGEEELTCDEASEDVAYCEDDSRLMLCSEGHWWELNCGDIEPGSFCGEDPDTLLVDCAVDGEDLTE